MSTDAMYDEILKNTERYAYLPNSVLFKSPVIIDYAHGCGAIHWSVGKPTSSHTYTPKMTDSPCSHKLPRVLHFEP